MIDNYRLSIHLFEISNRPPMPVTKGLIYTVAVSLNVIGGEDLRDWFFERGL